MDKTRNTILIKNWFIASRSEGVYSMWGEVQNHPFFSPNSVVTTSKITQIKHLDNEDGYLVVTLNNDYVCKKSEFQPCFNDFNTEYDKIKNIMEELNSYT